MTNFLHPCCWQLWGKICGKSEHTAPTKHCVTVLQVLVQSEWQMILWTHHQVGLQWTKVHLLMPNYINKGLVHFWHPPAWKRQDQNTLMSSPNMGQKCNIHKKKTIPMPLMRLERNSYKRYAVFSFSCTCGWQRTTPSAQLTCFPAGKPNR